LSWKNICASESCCGSIDEMDPGSVIAAKAVLRIGGDALPVWAEEVEDGLEGDVGEEGLDVRELNAHVSN
jgi:hypothetical protein